jgi:hypothetical protein
MAKSNKKQEPIKQLSIQILSQCKQFNDFILSDQFKNQIINQDISSDNSPYKHGDQTLLEAINDAKKSIKIIEANSSKLDSINFDLRTNINSNFTNIVSWLPSIFSYYPNFIQQVNQIQNSIYQAGMNFEVKIPSKTEIDDLISDYKTEKPLIESVIAKQEDYKKTLEILDEFINKQAVATEIAVNGQSEAYQKLAGNFVIHNIKSPIKWKFYKNPLQWWRLFFNSWTKQLFGGSWWWMLSAFIFAGLTSYVTYGFYQASVGIDKITSGTALLRVASLLVPSYLTVFSISQYLYSKKMHDAYLFKHATLLTVNNLIKINPELNHCTLKAYRF